LGNGESESSDNPYFIEFEVADPDALEQDWNYTDKADAIYREAHHWLARGHFAKAAETFDQATRHDRSHYQATVGRTEALILLGREDEAARVIDEALQRFGRNPALGAARGHVFLHHDNIDLALQCSDLATRMAPDSAYAWLIAGETRLAIRDGLWSAEQSFETAQECNDRWPYFDMRIALAFLEWGHMKKALAALRSVVQTHKRLAFAWILYGDAYRLMKRTRDAKACYARAAALEPELESVQQALGLGVRLAKGLDTARSAIFDLFRSDD